MLPNSGDSTDPWAVPSSGMKYRCPSNTPTFRHLPISRMTDLSAIRSWSISCNIDRSMLSKYALTSASRITFALPCPIARDNALRVSGVGLQDFSFLPRRIRRVDSKRVTFFTSFRLSSFAVRRDTSYLFVKTEILKFYPAIPRG